MTPLRRFVFIGAWVVLVACLVLAVQSPAGCVDCVTTQEEP